MGKPVNVLFLAAEAAPLIKVGGLGDVAGSLPLALRRLDRENALDVRVVIPYHGDIQRRMPNLEPVAEFLVPSRRGAIQAQAYSTEIRGMPVYLIGGPYFTPDEPVYSPDYERDGHKYVFFSLAALELAHAIGWQPDVLHANDWHTALSVYSLCRQRSLGSFYRNTRTVITIHNLPYLGDSVASALEEFNIPATQNRSLPYWAREFALPLGMLAADKIVAVSPSYAEEIKTPEFGCGLQDFLTERAADLTGILNGLDLVDWDPATDLTISHPFARDSLDKRSDNKSALLEEVQLPTQHNVPLLAFIGRMDQQKGVDIALEGLRRLENYPWQAIFLGTGSSMLESSVRSLEIEFPDRVRGMIRFDARLARQIYAGSDILMMPSRYEPCGLAQMIAMRYGCLPLARATGGLIDTIEDLDLSDPGTGILFQEANPEDLCRAALRAMEHYRQREQWRAAQLRAMQVDFSWDRSAQAYAGIYDLLADQQNPDIS